MLFLQSQTIKEKCHHILRDRYLTGRVDIISVYNSLEKARGTP
jgi:hypothetical protein